MADETNTENRSNRDAAAAPSIDTMTREEAEVTAAAVLRAIAKESGRRHRNIVTATREASQLVHLAIKLEGFANAR